MNNKKRKQVVNSVFEPILSQAFKGEL